MDDFGVPLGQVLGIGSGWLIVSIGVLGLFKGWLVTRREAERIEHDANEWRTSDRIKDQVVITELDNIKAAVEAQGRTLHDFIAALQKVTGPNEGDK